LCALVAMATRAAYKFFSRQRVRWMDCDMLGHMNSPFYYVMMECGLTDFYMSNGVFRSDAAVPVCGASSCRFVRPFQHHEIVDVGLRVASLQPKAATFRIGLFHEEEQRAVGEYTHVWVSCRDSNGERGRREKGLGRRGPRR